MDSEIKGRPNPLIENVAKVLAAILALFSLYTGLFGTLDSLMQREIVLFLGLLLVFIIYPSNRKVQNYNTLYWQDLVFIGVTIICFTYLFYNYTYIRGIRVVYLTPYNFIDYFVAIGLIVCVLEATRRVLGKALPVVALLGFLYVGFGKNLPGFLSHTGFSLEMILDVEVFTMQGIFGVPLGVASTYLFMFILFGNALNSSGFGDLLMTIARAIAGNKRGGPAKIAVLASAFFGMLSGSSTGNAVTTGAFTIPLMKKTGLSAEFSSAVEAAASTGGQIMPPIVGAAGLLMVQLAAVPFTSVMKWSALPAILYFMAIWFMVDFRSAKMRLEVYKEKVEWKKELKEKWHLCIPVVLLVYLLISGKSIMLSGSYAVASTFVLANLRPATRMTVPQVIDAMISASKSALTVITATATAGAFVGVIGLTGLGLKFSSLIVAMAAGFLLPSLILAMAVGLILGMGLPTAAAYIVQVALVVPALVRLGIPTYVAHLFVVYFAPMSMITPPIAITAFAAAGVGGADQMKTGWEAVKLACAGFIVPFMFVYNQNLLLEGLWYNVVIAVVTSSIGIYFLAMSVEGFWKRKLNISQRVLAFAVSLLLIYPGIWTDLIGVCLMVLIYLWQKKNADTGIYATP